MPRTYLSEALCLTELQVALGAVISPDSDAINTDAIASALVALETSTAVHSDAATTIAPTQQHHHNHHTQVVMACPDILLRDRIHAWRCSSSATIYGAHALCRCLHHQTFPTPAPNPDCLEKHSAVLSNIWIIIICLGYQLCHTLDYYVPCAVTIVD